MKDLGNATRSRTEDTLRRVSARTSLCLEPLEQTHFEGFDVYVNETYMLVVIAALPLELLEECLQNRVSTVWRVLCCLQSPGPHEGRHFSNIPAQLL